MTDKRAAELVFPLKCHFRVIAEDRGNMHFVIETVLMELGVHDRLEKGNASSGGKYVSFCFSTTVASMAALNLIDQELRLIEGVRMVL